MYSYIYIFQEASDLAGVSLPGAACQLLGMGFAPFHTIL